MFGELLRFIRSDIFVKSGELMSVLSAVSEDQATNKKIHVAGAWVI